MIELPIPEREFYFLSGPMRGYPDLNIAAFREARDKLEAKGYSVFSPYLAFGAVEGEDWLWRDAALIAHPYCAGVICLPGWEDSFGASQIEVYLADRRDKETLAYSTTPDGDPVLIAFDYKTRIQEG